MVAPPEMSLAPKEIAKVNVSCPSCHTSQQVSILSDAPSY